MTDGVLNFASMPETKWIIAVESLKGLADDDPFLVEFIEKALMLLFQTCRSFLKKMLSDVPTRHDFQVHVIMLRLLFLYLYFVTLSWLFCLFSGYSSIKCLERFIDLKSFKF